MTEEAYRFLSEAEQMSEEYCVALNDLTELAQREGRSIMGHTQYGSYACPIYRGEISEPEIWRAIKRARVKAEKREQFFATLKRELRNRGLKVWLFATEEAEP